MKHECLINSANWVTFLVYARYDAFYWQLAHLFTLRLSYSILLRCKAFSFPAAQLYFCCFISKKKWNEDLHCWLWIIIYVLIRFESSAEMKQTQLDMMEMRNIATLPSNWQHSNVFSLYDVFYWVSYTHKMVNMGANLIESFRISFELNLLNLLN